MPFVLPLLSVRPAWLRRRVRKLHRQGHIQGHIVGPLVTSSVLQRPPKPYLSILYCTDMSALLWNTMLIFQRNTLEHGPSLFPLSTWLRTINKSGSLCAVTINPTCVFWPPSMIDFFHCWLDNGCNRVTHQTILAWCHLMLHCDPVWLCSGVYQQLARLLHLSSSCSVTFSASCVLLRLTPLFNSEAGITAIMAPRALSTQRPCAQKLIHKSWNDVVILNVNK